MQTRNDQFYNSSDNGFNTSYGAGLSNLFGGLFTDMSKPYQKAEDQYSKYLNKAQQSQNPFYNAGVGALPNYQNWLTNMQNPSQFINNLMGQYQESPFAKYQQQQSQRAGINAASASGLTGSTPFAQQLQQNSYNISSQDMNNWLQNVLGINTQYGQGQQNLVNYGQHAGDILSQLFGNAGSDLAQLGYSKELAKQQGTGNVISGVLGILGL